MGCDQIALEHFLDCQVSNRAGRAIDVQVFARGWDAALFKQDLIRLQMQDAAFTYHVFDAPQLLKLQLADGRAVEHAWLYVLVYAQQHASVLEIFE